MVSGYPSDAPGADFHSWDAVSRRRFGVSRRAIRPSWDVPDDWSPPRTQEPDYPRASAPERPSIQGHGVYAGTPATGGSGGNPVAGTMGSSGDPYLDAERATRFQDALGSMIAARHAAQTGAPNDPSLAGFAGLSALINGQGAAAHDMTQAASGVYGQLRARDIEEQLAEFQANLQRRMYEEMNRNSWLGDLGQVLGAVGGSWLSPGGLWG